MGMEIHEPVVAVINLDCASDAAIEALRARMNEEAPRFARLIIGPVSGVVNNWVAWIFAPDGSKEGWDDDREADKWRDLFIDAVPKSHGGYVHVAFGIYGEIDNGPEIIGYAPKNEADHA